MARPRFPRWRIIPRPLVETVVNNHAHHLRVPNVLFLHGPKSPMLLLHRLLPSWSPSFPSLHPLLSGELDSLRRFAGCPSIPKRGESEILLEVAQVDFFQPKLVMNSIDVLRKATTTNESTIPLGMYDDSFIWRLIALGVNERCYSYQASIDFGFSDIFISHETFGWTPQKDKLHMVFDFLSESEWKVFEEVLGSNPRHLLSLYALKQNARYQKIMQGNNFEDTVDAYQAYLQKNALSGDFTLKIFCFSDMFVATCLSLPSDFSIVGHVKTEMRSADELVQPAACLSLPSDFSIVGRPKTEMRSTDELVEPAACLSVPSDLSIDGHPKTEMRSDDELVQPTARLSVPSDLSIDGHPKTEMRSDDELVQPTARLPVRSDLSIVRHPETEMRSDDELVEPAACRSPSSDLSIVGHSKTEMRSADELVEPARCLSIPSDLYIAGYSKTEMRSGEGLTKLFESWMLKHEKSYSSAKEKQKRFRMFVKKLKELDETNKKGLSYRVGLNQFSDMTYKEMTRISLKVPLSPPGTKFKIPKCKCCR